MKNNYEIRGDVTVIFMNRKGGIIETIIDTEDFEKVKTIGNSWCFHGGGYAISRVNNRMVLLHKIIMDDILNEYTVDHVNRNGLDNRKSNLRFCTQAENNQNRSINKSSTSGRRGVYWNAYHQKWTAVTKLNRKKYFIGHFDSVQAADEAVKDARSKLMPFSPEAEHNLDGLKYYKDKDKPFSTNKLGKLKYVGYDKSRSSYFVRIVRNKKFVFFKRYKTLEEALKAREEALQEYGII